MSLPNDPDTQMNSGLQIIQQAFKAQYSILTEEINQLHLELESKNAKIEELEESSQKLFKDNKHLNQLVDKLTNENSKYKQLNGNNNATNNSNQPIKPETPTIGPSSTSNISTPQNSYCYNFKKQYMNTQSSYGLKLNNQRMDNIISSLDDSINKIVKTTISNSNNPIKSSILSIAPLKRIDYSATNIRVNDHTDDGFSERRSDYTVKSKNHIVNTDFFKTCRATLKKVEYSQLIDIVKMSNSKIITKKETYARIEKLLQGKYNELFIEFKDIFQYKDY